LSTLIMAACWPLQVSPTAKSVLMSLADNANDNGVCWPSIPTICRRTCLCRRSVIRALQTLEDGGIIVKDGAIGRHNTYRIQPESYSQPVSHGHRCQSDTSALEAQTSATEALPPVPQRHPNRHLNRKNPKSARARDGVALDAPPSAPLAEETPQRDVQAVISGLRSVLTPIRSEAPRPKPAASVGDRPPGGAVPDAVRAELETRKPIPIPTPSDEDETLQAAQA
jgi:hypothetical protein